MNNPADTLAAQRTHIEVLRELRNDTNPEGADPYGNMIADALDAGIAALASLKGEAVVPALEVFRVAGGDVECCPNPTAAEAMDCLRDLRQCYEESLTTPPTPQAVGEASFQQRVQPWMLECFGAAIAADVRERCDRFIEESLELAQAVGYDLSRVAALVEYTDSRPAGEPSQEVGGVMVTLAALCLACDLDMHAAGETELARILRPEIIEKIRAKQAAKARDIPFSPLPQATPTPAPQGGGEVGCGEDKLPSWRSGKATTPRQGKHIASPSCWCGPVRDKDQENVWIHFDRSERNASSLIAHMEKLADSMDVTAGIFRKEEPQTERTRAAANMANAMADSLRDALDEYENATPPAQQPGEVVTDEMVERAIEGYWKSATSDGARPGISTAWMRDALTAALAPKEIIDALSPSTQPERDGRGNG